VTIWAVLHDAGISWQRDRTWCETGVAIRIRMPIRHLLSGAADAISADNVRPNGAIHSVDLEPVYAHHSDADYRLCNNGAIPVK